MDNIEIRQGMVERMAYRKSYQWDTYARVFEDVAEVYDIPRQGAYNPMGMIGRRINNITTTNSREMMMSSVKMTHV
nr:hypothetical protein [Tanacetum cinerariifolium]